MVRAAPSVAVGSTAPPPQNSAPVLGGYRVHGTKKGSIPLSTESRAKGKKVTVLRNVDGDMQALLKDLKESLGTGGLAHENGTELEIQGEHEDRIAAFLKKKGCLVGVKGCGKAAEPPPKLKPKAAPSAPAVPPTPVAVATPDSKDQKKYVQRLQKFMDSDFVQRHNLQNMSNNAMTKMKYSEFIGMWKDFVEVATDSQRSAVLTGRVA